MFPFKLALNASTLFPFRLGLKEQIEVAAKAGYAGLEIWVRDLEHYINRGGSLTELRAFVESQGISIVNAIAFWPWADSDETRRREGLELTRRELSWLAELGCSKAAAPPFGDVDGQSLDAIAEHFANLATLSQSMGVDPILEFWGHANRLSRLCEATYVAMQSGVPGASILVDPFHMHKGGSHLEDLSFLCGAHIGMVHVNDYPLTPARDTITDADRVFPGEGALDFGRFSQLLSQSGYTGFLSLELFISDFGDLTALDVATRGIESMRRAFGTL